MAGVNKVLKGEQVLFKAGDASDGMYLIRKGELRVYLEQEGKEVTLANIPAGGMIGEMALFDRKPRSASVKAVNGAEVTLISNDDFYKLMKQIPKWFVGLMSTLSTRLRDTNERLQKLENGGATAGKSYRTANRLLNVLLLVWHKDGEKKGKEYTLPKKTTEAILIETFDEDAPKVREFFEILVKEKYVHTSTDEYNNVVFSTNDRGRLTLLTQFIQEFVKLQPPFPCFSEDTLNLLSVLQKAVEESPYDTTSMAVEDLIEEGNKLGFTTGKWKECLPQLKYGGDSVKLVKMSSGIGARSNKKEIGNFIRFHRTMSHFFKANLA